jgi:regulator of replication initiation timing
MSGKDKMAAKLVSAYVDDFPCRFVDGDTSILPLPPPEGSGQKVVSIIPFAGPLIAVIGKLFQQVKNLTTRINNLQQENDSLAARSARATTATSPPAYGGPSQAENELKKVVENLEEQLRQARRQIDSLQEEKQNHVCNTGGGNAQAEAATLRGQVATLQRQVQSMSMNNAVQFFPGKPLIDANSPGVSNCTIVNAAEVNASDKMKISTAPHLFCTPDVVAAARHNQAHAGFTATKPPLWMAVILHSNDAANIIGKKLDEVLLEGKEFLVGKKARGRGIEMQVREQMYNQIKEFSLMPLLRDFISFCFENGLAQMNVEEAGKFFLPSAPHMKQFEQFVKLMSAAVAVEYDIAQAAAFASAQHNLGDQNLIAANAKSAGIDHYPVKQDGYSKFTARGRGRGNYNNNNNRGGRGGNPKNDGERK